MSLAPTYNFIVRVVTYFVVVTLYYNDVLTYVMMILMTVLTVISIVPCFAQT